MVKRIEAPLTQLCAAVDTEDLPGRVYTQMDVVNDVFIHSSSKQNFFVRDWNYENRPKEANKANDINLVCILMTRN